MEPRQQGPSGGLEKGSFPSVEHGLKSPEFGQEQTPERVGEKIPEIGQVQAEAAQIAMPALPTPVMAPDPVVQITTDDDVPSMAADDDLIEKEWVDKAKKIISATRDDPYRREREISKLQIEYIRRRYGREIGNSGDE